MSKSAAEEAMDWVTSNMSWDEYEGDWENAGCKTFLAGVQWLIAEAEKKKLNLPFDGVANTWREDVVRMSVLRNLVAGAK